jgi:pSer/pThr/pTyr-binding forkhead associated (FHA) protein
MLPLSGQPITIGRAAGNTLVFEDDYASSHHARLFQAAEGWVIEDLNSTNGTFIEGAPLTGAALLPVGVPVTIGHSTFKLVV